MDLLSAISDSTVSYNLLELAIPEIKKSIRKVAPYGKGYKLPIYGKIKANKDYEDLLDAIINERLELKMVEPGKIYKDEVTLPVYAEGIYSQKKWHEGVKYDDVIGNSKKAYSGKNVLNVGTLKSFEKRYGKEKAKQKQLEVIFHEMLHGIGEHYGEGRNTLKEDFISTTLFPESTGSYNKQAKTLLQKYMESN